MGQPSACGHWKSIRCAYAARASFAATGCARHGLRAFQSESQPRSTSSASCHCESHVSVHLVARNPHPKASSVSRWTSSRRRGVRPMESECRAQLQRLLLIISGVWRPGKEEKTAPKNPEFLESVSFSQGFSYGHLVWIICILLHMSKQSQI